MRRYDGFRKPWIEPDWPLVGKGHSWFGRVSTNLVLLNLDFATAAARTDIGRRGEECENKESISISVLEEGKDVLVPRNVLSFKYQYYDMTSRVTPRMSPLFPRQLPYENVRN